jgi:hypothetical protein
MKELHGHASTDVAAPIEECFALLEALDRYPAWYPEVVAEATVLDAGADGRAATVRTKLHVTHGPLVKDFDLLLAVRLERPATVTLTRIPREQGDRETFEVTWRLAGDAITHIELELDASLSVPRLVPLGGVGDAIAQGFVRAASRALGTPPQ